MILVFFIVEVFRTLWLRKVRPGVKASLLIEMVSFVFSSRFDTRHFWRRTVRIDESFFSCNMGFRIPQASRRQFSMSVG